MVRNLVLAAAALTLSTTASLAEGDIAAGEKVFAKCKACHMVGEGAKNRVGPTLNAVVGREWGIIDGYKYSDRRDGTLLKMKEEDPSVAWDIPTLTAYLTKPKDVIPKGKMAFGGLRKPDDITNVIAFLAQYGEDGSIVDGAAVIEAATPSN